MLMLLFFWVGVVNCAPSIIALRGCVSEKGAVTTFNCPTDSYDNGLLLTVLGKQLCPQGICATLFVGGSECVGAVSAPINASVVSELLASGALSSDEDLSSLTCLLSNGVGTDLNVYIADGTGGELVQGLISYAPPTVSNLSAPSCVLATNGVVSCPRNKSILLTIRGQNLGSAITVSVGSFLCNFSSWITVHSVVTCVLPPSSLLNQQVSVSQINGQSTESGFFVSFQQCAPGYWADSTLCVLCAAGKYSSVSEASDCSSCSVGQYSKEGAWECTECEPGRVSAMAGASICSDCLGGTFSSVSGASQCHLCATGRFSASPGRVECERCPITQITPVSPALGCVECPVNALPARNLTYCECDAGFYEAPNQKECVECPEGSICARSGMTYASLQAAAGFRPTIDGQKTRFIECLNDACTLGQCIQGYQGPLCGECAPNYGVMFRNTCSACWAAGVPEIVTAVVGFVLLLLIAVLVWRVQVSDETDRAVVVAKLLVTTLQMNAMVAELLPSGHSSVLGSLLVLQESFISVPLNVISNDCLFKNKIVEDFYSDSVIIALLPFVWVIGVLVLGLLAGTCAKLCWGRGERRSVCRGCCSLLAPSSLVTVFCLYYVINRQILQMFSCLRLSDEPARDFLVRDMTQQCWSSVHVTWILAVALPCLVIYSIGFPVGSFIVMCRNRGLKKKPGLAFMEGGFQGRFFWWECFIFLRTWLCAAISVFWVNDRQSAVACALFIIVVFGACHCVASPYRSRSVNVLEGISLLGTFLALIACQLEWFGGNTVLARVLGALAILAFAFFLLGVCVLALTRGRFCWPCDEMLYRFCMKHRKSAGESVSYKIHELFNRGGSVSALVYHNEHNHLHETELNPLRPNASPSPSTAAHEREIEMQKIEEKHKRELKQWQALAKKQGAELQVTNEELVRLRKQLMEFVEWEEEMSRLLKYYDGRGGTAKRTQQQPQPSTNAQNSSSPPPPPPPLSQLYFAEQHSSSASSSGITAMDKKPARASSVPPSLTSTSSQVKKSSSTPVFSSTNASSILPSADIPATSTHTVTTSVPATVSSLEPHPPSSSALSSTPTPVSFSHNPFRSDFSKTPNPSTTTSHTPSNISSLSSRRVRTPASAPPSRPIPRSTSSPPVPSANGAVVTTTAASPPPAAPSLSFLDLDLPPPPPPDSPVASQVQTTTNVNASPLSDLTLPAAKASSAVPSLPLPYIPIPLGGPTNVPTIKKPPLKPAPTLLTPKLQVMPSPTISPTSSPKLSSQSVTSADTATVMLPSSALSTSWGWGGDESPTAAARSAPPSPWSAYTSSNFAASPLVDNSQVTSTTQINNAISTSSAPASESSSSLPTFSLDQQETEPQLNRQPSDSSGYLHSRNESLGLDSPDLVNEFLASRPLSKSVTSAPGKSPPPRIPRRPQATPVSSRAGLSDILKVATASPGRSSASPPPNNSPIPVLSLPSALSNELTYIPSRPNLPPSRPPPLSPENRTRNLASGADKPGLKIEPSRSFPNTWDLREASNSDSNTLNDPPTAGLPRLSPPSIPPISGASSSSSIAQNWRAQQLKKLSLKNTSPIATSSNSFSFPTLTSSTSTSTFASISPTLPTHGSSVRREAPTRSVVSDLPLPTESAPSRRNASSELANSDALVAKRNHEVSVRAQTPPRTKSAPESSNPDRDSFFTLPDSDSE